MHEATHAAWRVPSPREGVSAWEQLAGGVGAAGTHHSSASHSPCSISVRTAGGCAIILARKQLPPVNSSLPIFLTQVSLCPLDPVEIFTFVLQG